MPSQRRRIFFYGWPMGLVFFPVSLSDTTYAEWAFWCSKRSEGASTSLLVGAQLASAGHVLPYVLFAHKPTQGEDPAQQVVCERTLHLRQPRADILPRGRPVGQFHACMGGCVMASFRRDTVCRSSRMGPIRTYVAGWLVRSFLVTSTRGCLATR